MFEALCKAKGVYKDISADVVSSVGVEIHEIEYKKKVKHKVVTRQVRHSQGARIEQ